MDDPISTERLNLMNFSYVTEKYPNNNDDFINDKKNHELNPSNLGNFDNGNNNEMFLSFGPNNKNNQFEKDDKFYLKKIKIKKTCLLKSKKFQKYKECNNDQISNNFLLSEDSFF